MDFGTKFEKSPDPDVWCYRSSAKHRRTISFALADKYDPKKALKYKNSFEIIFEKKFLLIFRAEMKIEEQ